MVCGSEAAVLLSPLQQSGSGNLKNQGIEWKTPEVGNLWPLLHLLWWQGFAFLPGVLILHRVVASCQSYCLKRNMAVAVLDIQAFLRIHDLLLMSLTSKQAWFKRRPIEHRCCSIMIYQPFAHRNVFYEICWYHCRFQDVGVAHKRRHAQCTHVRKNADIYRVCIVMYIHSPCMSKSMYASISWSCVFPW